MLIGREHQLDEIRARIERVIDGSASSNVLFVTGEAGIGKSAFLNLVRDECTVMEPAILVAIADCSTPLAGTDIGEVEALQPWAEIMRRLATGERTTQTRKLVTDLAMAWIRCIPVVGDVLESVADTAHIVQRFTNEHGPSDAVTSINQQQVFQQYINVLEKLSEGSPLVLMLDDFHWADTSSVNLLFTAARQLQGRPILFIIAYRPDDAASSRGGEGHPILHIRNELERYSLAGEVEVTRLSIADIDRLLHTRYPDYQNNDEFEAWLATVSDGNALFVTQFLETLESDGHINRQHGTIRDDFATVTPPQSIQAVIMERIRRMSQDARELLRYASVEGDVFTSTILARITELSELKLLQKLRIIEEMYGVIHALGRRRIYASETSAHQFAHALLHATMYDSLDEMERSMIHEIVFDILKQEWEKAQPSAEAYTAIAARIAIHAQILLKHRFAAETLLKGARALQHRMALHEALEMTGKALAALDRETDDDGIRLLRAEALTTRAGISLKMGQLEESIRDFQQARTLSESLDHAVWINAINGEAVVLFWLGDNAGAEREAHLALAEATAHNDPDGEAKALNTIARIMMFHSPDAEALEWRQRCVEAARKLNDGGAAESTALNEMGMLLRAMGRKAEAIESFQRSLELSRKSHDLMGEANVLNNLGVIAMNGGDIEPARHYFTDAMGLCLRVGDNWTRAYCANNLGVLAQYEEHYDEAVRQFDHSRALNHAVGDTRGEAGAIFNLGDTCQTMKEYEKAAEYYRQSLKLYQELDDHNCIAYVCAGMGSLAFDRGDLAEARTLYEEATGHVAGIDDIETEALVVGGLGQVEAAEAERLVGAERQQGFAQAVSHLEECIALLQPVNQRSIEQWQNVLESVRSRMQSSEQVPE
jgi:predicted ATPase